MMRSETLYKIRLADGTELPGAARLAQAKAQALWEDGPCTFIALTHDEQWQEEQRNLRFALGFDADDADLPQGLLGGPQEKEKEERRSDGSAQR